MPRSAAGRSSSPGLQRGGRAPLVARRWCWGGGAGEEEVVAGETARVPRGLRRRRLGHLLDHLLLRLLLDGLLLRLLRLDGLLLLNHLLLLRAVNSRA